MSDIQTQLANEMAEIAWSDLKPHAQRDAIILVNEKLDLIKVGEAIASDDTLLVQHWISEQLIRKPLVEELGNWNSHPEKQFTTIIVQPFVLIKEVHISV
jgi:hypothetical protein